MTDPIHLRLVRRAATEIRRRAHSAAVRRALRAVGAAGAASIDSFTTLSEREALFDLARRCPPAASAVEIGSHVGASTSYLAAGLHQVGARLYCIDTWRNDAMLDGPRDTMPEFDRNTAGFRNMITLVRKRTDQLAPCDLPSTVDLAFIDADHAYEVVSGDFRLILPRLAPQAVVAFHDHLYFQGVAKLIGEILAGGSWIVAGQIENLLWIRRTVFGA